MGFLGRRFRASGVGRWRRLVCEWESCGEGRQQGSFCFGFDSETQPAFGVGE